MKNVEFVNKIICCDALTLLARLEDNSIDAALTDPPYFLDKLDNNWDYEKVSCKNNQHTIKSLPAGMKFDREQGRRFYEWYLEISRQVLRALKPGSFFFSFSSPRLYHRMAAAMEDAGFEIKDSLAWLYTQNQMKAMSVNHFIKKMNVDEKTKSAIKAKLDGWKTPQIKSCFEPIAMAQKPGADTADEADETVFLQPKPLKKEKGGYNDHKTVKPLSVCESIINLSALPAGAVVLDPFMGSGTTAVAAKKLGKNFIGADINHNYVKIAEHRIAELDAESYSPGIHPRQQEFQFV